MMSPMSVAQYLIPEDASFDLIVMDEASQIRPEDALGALTRGAQVVIVGDAKQLPPTSFFDRISDDDVPDEELTAVQQTESILEIAERVLPSRTLVWHYRSQHPSLIAFSNSHFYHNLIIPPSPYAQHPDYGIREHFIENARYARSRNIHEAKAIAEAARQHLLERPAESLGLVAMNSEQRDLILNELERLQKEDVHFDEVLRQQAERSDALFVKNLENVQGDERDVIFISVTYGPDPETGQIFQRFGPISGEKGWRRLNVLFTRARKRVELFTSLRSAQIIVGDSSSRGVAALRAYLEFAASGQLVDIGQPSERSPDSDFEIEVARLLALHGHRVDVQVGVAGFFVDIAVRHPGDQRTYALGIECDGAAYHSAKSVRDRDRLREEILRAKGWKLHRIWSTDWFNNRETELRRLLDAVDLALRAGGGAPTPAPERPRVEPAAAPDVSSPGARAFADEVPRLPEVTSHSTPVLAALLSRYELKSVDGRSNGDPLYVDADDSDPELSIQLRALGFTYNRHKKRWWTRDRGDF
jgi:very-short-patch-repair endonuclease